MGLIGTAETLAIKFRIMGTVKIAGSTSQFSLVTLTLSHECKTATLTQQTVSPPDTSNTKQALQSLQTINILPFYVQTYDAGVTGCFEYFIYDMATGTTQITSFPSYLTFNAITPSLTFGTSTPQLISTQTDFVQYKLYGRIKIAVRTPVLIPVDFTLQHECYGKTISDSTSGIGQALSYTIGSGAHSYDLSSGFTFTAGTLSYCFTYSLVMSDSTAVSLPITWSLSTMSLTLTGAVGSLTTASSTYNMLLKGQSIFTGVTPVPTPIALTIYHECYSATLTPPANQALSYFVGDPQATLTYALFTTNPAGCLVDYVLQNADGTAPNAAFGMTVSGTQIDVYIQLQTTNALVNVNPYQLRVLATNHYGPQTTAYTQAAITVIENPCIATVVPTTTTPPTLTFTVDSTSQSLLVTPATIFTSPGTYNDPSVSGVIRCITMTLNDGAGTLPTYIVFAYPYINYVPNAGNSIASPEITYTVTLTAAVNLTGIAPVIANVNIRIRHLCFDATLSTGAQNSQITSYPFTYTITQAGLSPFQTFDNTNSGKFQFQNTIHYGCAVTYKLFWVDPNPDQEIISTHTLYPIVQLQSGSVLAIISSSNNALAGIYNLKVQAQITFADPTNNLRSIGFSLTVKHQCTLATLSQTNTVFSLDFTDLTYSSASPIQLSINTYTAYNAGLNQCIQFTYNWINGIESDGNVLANGLSLTQIVTYDSNTAAIRVGSDLANQINVQFITHQIRVDANLWDGTSTTSVLTTTLTFTVYHKCYHTILIQPGDIIQGYSFIDPLLSASTSQFTTYLDCTVSLSFFSPTGVALTFPWGPLSWSAVSNTQYVVTKAVMTNPADLGFYFIRVVGQLDMGPSHNEFWVKITLSCTINSLMADPLDTVASETMSVKEYAIGDPEMVIVVHQFVTDVQCGLAMHYKAQSQGGGNLPEFISFEEDLINGGGKIKIYSKTRKGVFQFNWMIEIEATTEKGYPPIYVGSSTSSVKQTATLFVPIYIAIPNLGAPKFKQAPNDIKVQVLDFYQLKLSKVFDPDPEDTVSTIIVDFGDAAPFVKGKFPFYMISPISNATDPGIYEVKITLGDDNPTPGMNLYTFKLKVLPLPPEAEEVVTPVVRPGQARIVSKEKLSQKLSQKIKSITSTGLVTVNFNLAMSIPGNITAIDSSVLGLLVLPSPDSEAKYLKITKWTVKKFTSRQMQIQVYFENPVWISQVLGSPDVLQIEFLDPQFFKEKDTGKMIQYQTKIRKNLPRQMKLDGASGMLLASSGPAKTSVSTMMYGNLAVNLAMSASLSMLWGMINVMQLIVKMPLLNITFPQNAATFYTLISDVANFDLLPTDKINSYVFKFSEQEQSDLNFNSMGYNTDNIFDNLGSMMFYIIGFFVLVAFSYCIKALKSKYKLVEIVYDYLAKTLFWNMIIRLILEGYLEYSISAIINCQNLFWVNSSDYIASIISILSLGVVLVFPFLIWVLLWKKFTVLNLDATKLAFGSTYGDLRHTSKSALLYNVIYMLRRLFIAILATQLKMQSFAQIQLIVLHSILIIIYSSLVKPFEEPVLNKLEVFNESCILLAATHLFWFTDFVADPETQYACGWSIIGVSVFNIIVNMIVMVKASFRQMKIGFYEARYKYREWLIKWRAQRKLQYNTVKPISTDNLEASKVSANASIKAKNVSALRGGLGSDLLKIEEFDQIEEEKKHEQSIVQKTKQKRRGKAARKRQADQETGKVQGVMKPKQNHLSQLTKDYYQQQLAQFRNLNSFNNPMSQVPDFRYFGPQQNYERDLPDDLLPQVGLNSFDPMTKRSRKNSEFTTRERANSISKQETQEFLVKDFLPTENQATFNRGRLISYDASPQEQEEIDSVQLKKPCVHESEERVKRDVLIIMKGLGINQDGSPIRGADEEASEYPKKKMTNQVQSNHQRNLSPIKLNQIKTSKKKEEMKIEEEEEELDFNLSDTRPKKQQMKKQ